MRKRYCCERPIVSGSWREMFVSWHRLVAEISQHVPYRAPESAMGAVPAVAEVHCRQSATTFATRSEFKIVEDEEEANGSMLKRQPSSSRTSSSRGLLTENVAMLLFRPHEGRTEYARL